MASLVLGVAGAAFGPSLFGGGFSLFGAAISGAQIGGALGTFLGSEIDAAIAPGSHVTRNGPRLSDTQIQASSEGAAIVRLYGRVRIAGQLIWATRFKETIVTTKSGGGKGVPTPSVTQNDYTYSISFAVGLCAQATRIGARLGRREPDRSLELHDALLFRRRHANRRSPDRGDRRRGQRSRLSRPRLYRLRGHAARAVRQPHSAVAVRSAAQSCGGQSGRIGKPPSRRRPYPRCRRVRLCDVGRDAR